MVVKFLTELGLILVDGKQLLTQLLSLTVSLYHAAMSTHFWMIFRCKQYDRRWMFRSIEERLKRSGIILCHFQRQVHRCDPMQSSGSCRSYWLSSL